MLDPYSLMAIACTLLFLILYIGSLLFHSLRVDVHEYYKYVKYDKALNTSRVSTVQTVLRVLRIVAECYNLYQIVFLCSHPEYVQRHLYEMKHPGGHENQVWRIMVTWWALSLQDLISESVLHLYATSNDSFPPFAERFTVVVFVIESTVTVFYLNCPDANIRIGTKTIASIVMLLVSLITCSARFTSPKVRCWLLVGRIFVFVIGVALSGAIVFLSVIERVIESKTGATHVHNAGEEARVIYAYFQMTIVTVVFALQLVSSCTTQPKDRNSNEQQQHEPHHQQPQEAMAPGGVKLD